MGQAVVDRFMETQGRRPRVDLRAPNIGILAYVDPDILILAIDLCRRDINSVDSILRRLTVLASGWQQSASFSELYHAGVCESAYELSARIPNKEHIADSALADINLIDKDKILKMLSMSWTREPSEIRCYDAAWRPRRGYRIKIYPIERIASDHIEYFGSCLILEYPKRSSCMEALSTLVKHLTENTSWVSGSLIIRSELMRILGDLRHRKIADLNIRGIQSSVIRLSRV